MALKGSYNLYGKINVPNAYAVIDQISIGKNGDAYCHVSVYADPPVEVTTDQVATQQTLDLVDGAQPTRVAAQAPELDRGPVIEHFTISGISTADKVENAFTTCYAAAKADERLSAMSDA